MAPDRTTLIRRKLTDRKTTLSALSAQTGINIRTLQRHISHPDMMTLGELRAIHNRLRFTDEELARFGKAL